MQVSEATHQVQEAAIRMATIAKSAGVPQDSLRRFLSSGYVPQPKQMQFHAAARQCDESDGPTAVGFGGARGPGKSTGVLAQIGLDDCQRVPGLKWLYLRRVGKAARESFEDLRLKLLMGVPHEYKQSGVIQFQNGSRIITGHFQNERDIDNYLGLEFDGVGLEEATQLTAKKKQQILTCVRTSKPNWRPRSYLTFNPGGIGHSHIKQEFIKPWRENTEKQTRFVFATFRDNAFLNPEYVHVLDALVGWERLAWRDGDWDIAAGQFFSTWNYDVHVIKPYDVSHLDAWGGFDYGFTHMTACYPMVSDDGVLTIVGEHAEAKRLPGYHAEAIKQLGQRLNLKDEWLRKIYAGKDVFANKGDEQGKTIADQYKACGIKLLPANMDRISGASEILSRLGDVNANPPIRPTIKIFNTCVRLIECLPGLQHDPHRPEDVLKVDADEDAQGGDDPYDAIRYGVMARPSRKWFAV